MPHSDPAPPVPRRERYDAVVVGGGPSGSTFAALLARRGFEVLLVERDRHPRFHIGESLLPATLPVWRRLGVLERFERAGFLRKYGAYFCEAEGGRPELVRFANASRRLSEHAYEVPRADFDRILWEAAVEAGAEGLEETRVEEVLFSGGRAEGVCLRGPGGRAEGVCLRGPGGRAEGVCLRGPDGALRRVGARLVADCSGQATLVGRQLALREREAGLHKIALYCHVRDAIRSTGEDAGTLAIVAAPFGWMWLIPFAGGGASVGAVVEESLWRERRRAGREVPEIWEELLAEVPAVARRLRGAPLARPVEVTANFQYRLRELAGDGWLAIGDAGAFLDPIFSTGVHLAMTGAERASRAAARALARGRLPVARDFSRYARRTRAEQGFYERVIRAWYEPGFRALLTHAPKARPGVGLLRREFVSVLAGAASPPWRARPAVEAMLFVSRRTRRAPRPEAGA